MQYKLLGVMNGVLDEVPNLEAVAHEEDDRCKSRYENGCAERPGCVTVGKRLGSGDIL